MSVRIPLRVEVGSPTPFLPDDLWLHDGDSVRVTPRLVGVFQTSGKLPTLTHKLPLDRPLDVLEAVMMARGTNAAATGTLTVRRRLAGGRTVAIEVDLGRAAVDVRERICVKPGDVLELR